MSVSKILLAYQNGDFELCLRDLNKLSGSLTQDETMLKAEVLQKLKRYEEAMEIWNVAIANFGDQADFYAERGVCKFHLRFKSSIDDLNKAIELDPENGYRYACRAYVRDKIGDTEGAIEDYTKANELDPGNEITLNNLGLAEEKLGHTKKARDRFRMADELAGIDHITNKYFDKDPPKPEPAPAAPRSVKSELRKMLSSRKEFKLFWNEALKMIGLRK
ncbi:MAG: hypothetical protein JJ975_05065 [Bacteroidia bacterium]|nr:hypothetical protein [Bacteroidia bacterium]